MKYSKGQYVIRVLPLTPLMMSGVVIKLNITNGMLYPQQ